MGRFNVNGSDLPYAALFGEDPAPARDHVFYVSGLAEGTRIGSVLGALERGSLGRARCSFRSRGTQARASDQCMMARTAHKYSSCRAPFLATCSIIS